MTVMSIKEVIPLYYFFDPEDNQGVLDFAQTLSNMKEHVTSVVQRIAANQINKLTRIYNKDILT